MELKPLADQLWHYLDRRRRRTDFAYHCFEEPLGLKPKDKKALRDELRAFLFATMDEVRLRRAMSAAELLLRRYDLDDADHFIQGLVKREVSADIAYQKHRDHASHTLHNYILGWYVYSNNTRIRSEIQRHAELRHIQTFQGSPPPQIPRDFVATCGFRYVWSYVSLLHDLGYLFEGSLTALTTEIQNAQISIGADVAHDYFQHRFWKRCGIDSNTDRKRLIKMAPSVHIPIFSQRSIMAVADDLRDLGDLESLRKAVLEDRMARKIQSGKPDYLKMSGGLSGDSFDLWERHYKYYGQSSMVGRIKKTRLLFESLMRKGLPSSGVRVLDHGISGGLLLLLYSTFYFSLHFGLGNRPPKGASTDDRRVWKSFKKRTGSHGGYSAFLWWSGVVWATASVAMHNIHQQKESGLNQLHLEEDPLAACV